LFFYIDFVFEKIFEIDFEVGVCQAGEEHLKIEKAPRDHLLQFKTWERMTTDIITVPDE
jgi:hypothetical protein